MSRGLGPIQRAILEVLDEAGADDFERALDPRQVHHRVRRRLADRFERPEVDLRLDELPPDLQRIVLAIRATGRGDYIPSAVSAAISRAMRTLERRGLIRRAYGWRPARVWRKR